MLTKQPKRICQQAFLTDHEYTKMKHMKARLATKEINENTALPWKR
jgi:hypothetical protein